MEAERSPVRDEDNGPGLSLLHVSRHVVDFRFIDLNPDYQLLSYSPLDILAIFSWVTRKETLIIGILDDIKLIRQSACRLLGGERETQFVTNCTDLLHCIRLMGTQ